MKTTTKTKKLISLLLAILMATSAFAGLNLTAFAEDSGTCGTNCSWIIDNEGTLTIFPTDSTKDATMTDYNLASNIPWYNYKDNIKKVVAKDKVTNIGNTSFYNFNGIATVDLTDATSLTSIGANAFRSTGITSITIPSKVETIGDSAFNLCQSLETVDLSQATSLKTIGGYALQGCRKIKSIDLSGATSLKTIGSYSFNSTIITSITIPATVETIGDGAFSFSEFNKVTFLNKDTSIGNNVFRASTDDLLIVAPEGGTVESYCKTNNIKFRDVSIVDDGICGDNCSYKLDDKGTLTVFPTDPANDATMWPNLNMPWNDKKESIKKVVIKDKVTNIKGYSFYNCSNLTTVDLTDANSLTTIANYAFDTTAITSISIPKNVELIDNYCFIGCESLETVDLSNATSLKTIGTQAISYTALTEITIPANVETMKQYVFSGCSNLKKVNFLNKDVSMDYTVFKNCSPDLVITAPEGGNIESYCKNNNIKFRDVSIVHDGTCGDNCSWKLDDKGTLTIFPTDDTKDATMIDFRYLSGNPMNGMIESVNCPWYDYSKNIKKVVVKDKVTNIGNYAFYTFSDLTTVDLSETTSLTTIGENAFYDCESLETVDLSGATSLKTIGDSAFNKCQLLETVDLSSTTSLKTIGKSAFNSTAIKSITIPSKVESIGDSAFRYCYDLSTVDLSNATSLKTIGSCAFDSIAISSITIPSKVETIDFSAFYNCESLETVDLSNATSLKTIDTYAFRGVAIKSITIPAKVETIGEGAFCQCDFLQTADLSGATSLKTIDEHAFGITKIASIIIPSTVETVGKGAFDRCSELNKVTFVNKDVNIDEEVFYGCPSELVVYAPAGGTVESYCCNGHNFYDDKSHFVAFADYTNYSAILKQCNDIKDDATYTVDSRNILKNKIAEYGSLDTTNVYGNQTDIDNATNELKTAYDSLQKVPVTEPTTEPTTKPTTKPSTEPSTEPTTETTTKPSTQTTTEKSTTKSTTTKAAQTTKKKVDTSKKSPKTGAFDYVYIMFAVIVAGAGLFVIVSKKSKKQDNK